MNKKNKKQTKKSEKHGLTFLRSREVKKLPLLHVEWKDHAITGADGRWNTINDIKPKVVTCYSVGWQVAESEDSLVLSPNIGDNASAGELLTILKSCIVKKETL